MTLMALVVTVAFSGVSIALESWRRGNRSVEKMDQRSSVERLIKRQLALARPLKFVRDGNTFVLFTGSAQTLEFVSDYSLIDGVGDFRRIEYVLSDGRFSYRETPLYVDRTKVNGEPQTVVASFSKMSFRFVAAQKDGSTMWVDEWTDDMGVPVAVAVSIDDDTILVPMVNRS